MSDYHCEACDRYVNAKNVESHEAGKQHRKKVQQQASQSASVKRKFSKLHVQESIPEKTVQWLSLFQTWTTSQSEYEKRYLPLMSNLSSNGNLLAGQQAGVVKTNTSEPRVFGIDCEMVLTERPTKQGEPVQERVLARVSVVEWNWERNGAGGDLSCFSKGSEKLILDHYVQIPSDAKVIDLLTHVSGIEQHHVDNATKTAESIREELVALFGPQDILIGHSLWADFSALKWMHPHFLDTSLVFAIQDLTNFTPSLKDVVEELFASEPLMKSQPSSVNSEMKKVAEPKSLENNAKDSATETTDPNSAIRSTSSSHLSFQVAGESHDSVEDAKWAINIVAKVLSLNQENIQKMQLAPKPNPVSLLPFRLASVPMRLLRRLTIQNLPETATVNFVQEFFVKNVPKFSTMLAASTVTINDIKWSARTNGGRYGTCAVVFDSAADAKWVFEELPSTKFEGRFNRCKSGWPDHNRFLRKAVPVPESASSRSCNVFSYRRVGSAMAEADGFQPTPLLVNTIPQKFVGRLMGPKGRRIAMIRETTGVMVKVTQAQRGNAGANKRAKGEATLEYWADTREQVDIAAALVTEAVFHGKDLNIV